MIQIIHHREKCIGCDACTLEHPDRWSMDEEDGKAMLIGGTKKKHFYIVKTGDDELFDNEKAAESCPVSIIQLKRLR